MRLEWIDDLLALIDHATLTKAAQARLLTQPAFSRRLRTIEDHLGVELVDRAHRPARLTLAVLAQEGRLRELSAGLRELARSLGQSDAARRMRVVIAAQHAITTSITPHILRGLLPTDLSFRLRSANREECLALVMTRQADLMLCYQTDADRFASEDAFLEEIHLGRERLIPVFTSRGVAELRKSSRRNELPIVRYPRAVFFGRRMDHELLPHLPTTVRLTYRAETALTLAALQLAMVGVGVAWVPRSLVAGSLDDGTLADLSGWLPSSELTVAALRLIPSTTRSEAEEMVWDHLLRLGAGAVGLSDQALR